LEEIKTKVCSRCGIEKPINEFYKDKRRKGNLDIYCKYCRDEYYKLKYKEKIKNKTYDKISTKICCRCLQEKLISEFGKCSAATDGLKYCCKDCCHKERKEYYQNNKDVSQDYYINNHLVIILKDACRRAIKNNFQHDSIEQLYDHLKPIYDLGRCECCGKDLNICIDKGHFANNSFSIDRIVPKNGYVVGNVAILCHECNRQKNNTSLEKMKILINWVESRIKN
jgi:hypothetical protein